MAKKHLFLSIIFLVLIDQGLKLMIVNYFMGTHFYIIESVFGFRPVFNTQYSFVNNVLHLNTGLLPHFIFLLLIQLLVIFLYDYYKIQRRTKLLDVSFIFGQAGLICVFLGFLFWGKGVLDFILIYPLTIDVKDIYLNGLAFFFLLYYYKNKKKIGTPMPMADYFSLKIKKLKRVMKSKSV